MTRILAIAFACRPGHGSEPGVGWNFVDEVSRTRPVWLIVHEAERESLEAYLATQHRGHPIHATYVGLPGLEWLWCSHATLNVYYYLWHAVAARVARRLHEREAFDVVQHVSYTRYWMPSAGSRVGAPFVWGPVSGGESVPPAFRPYLGWRARLGQVFCNVVRVVMERDPALRANVRATGVAIAGTPETVGRLKRLGMNRVELMSAIALPADAIKPYLDLAPARDGVFRLVSVGKLAAWRGNHLAIEAFAKAGLPQATLTLIGKGPDQPRLAALAKRLGVADRVIFAGDLSHGEGLRVVAESHMLIHPTLRDSGGVIAEALGLGKPVICLDLGTPAVMVDATCGAKMPATTHAAVVDAFAEAMKRWRDEPATYQRLSEGARERFQELTRERRMARIYALHDEVIRGREAQASRRPLAVPATT